MLGCEVDGVGVLGSVGDQRLRSNHHIQEGASNQLPVNYIFELVDRVLALGVDRDLEPIDGVRALGVRHLTESEVDDAVFFRKIVVRKEVLDSKRLLEARTSRRQRPRSACHVHSSDFALGRRDLDLGRELYHHGRHIGFVNLVLGLDFKFDVRLRLDNLIDCSCLRLDLSSEWSEGDTRFNLGNLVVRPGSDVNFDRVGRLFKLPLAQLRDVDCSNLIILDVSGACLDDKLVFVFENQQGAVFHGVLDIPAKHHQTVYTCHGFDRILNGQLYCDFASLVQRHWQVEVELHVVYFLDHAGQRVIQVSDGQLALGQVGELGDLERHLELVNLVELLVF